jgi:hypothetical protein
MFTLGLLASSEICGVLEAVWYRFLDSFRSCFSVFLHWQPPPPHPHTHTVYALVRAGEATPARCSGGEQATRARWHGGPRRVCGGGASAIVRARVRRRGDLRCS